jgi:DNA-directed RNA polymerase subunit RPC12/RpoP
VIVRCGRCRSQFEAPGEGRFACPVCGAANEVRPTPADPGIVAPPPPPQEDPSPRVECGECGFRFIVGEVAQAPCPMCGAVVEIEG